MTIATAATAAATRTVVIQLDGSFTTCQSRDIRLKVPASVSAEQIEALLKDEEDLVTQLWEGTAHNLPQGYEYDGFSVEDEYQDGYPDYEVNRVLEEQD